MLKRIAKDKHSSLYLAIKRFVTSTRNARGKHSSLPLEKSIMSGIAVKDVFCPIQAIL